MAFNQDYLYPVGPLAARGKAPVRWTYKTADILTVVDAAGYFNAAAALLSVCDIIDVAVVTNLGLSNEALADIGALVVNANDGSVVDTTDETAYITTDTR